MRKTEIGRFICEKSRKIQEYYAEICYRKNLFVSECENAAFFGKRKKIKRRKQKKKRTEKNIPTFTKLVGYVKINALKQ